MTTTPIAERDVYRPTMSPKRQMTREVRVVEMVDGPGYNPDNPPEPPTEPLVVADGMGSNWLSTNDYAVGQTVEARTAQYAGGVQPVSYKARFQTRAAEGAAWVNGPWITVPNEKTAAFFELTAVGQIRFQTQAKDSAEEPVTLNSVTGVKVIVPTRKPLSAENPVATGTPMVGEVLTCSQPQTSGGIPPYQFSYAWVDATGDLIFENGYLLSDFVPTDADVGKVMECVVTITDQSPTRQTVVARSNTVGPIVPHPAEVIWEQNTTPTALALESGQRKTITVRARGYHLLTYHWKFKTPADTWVGANQANMEAFYRALFTLVDGEFQPSLSMSWFEGTPGPEEFRCEVRDTDPGGDTAEKTSNICTVFYPA